MHLLRLTFRFQLSSGKTILSAAFRVNLESATRVPTQSIFHLRAQGNAFHRDARQQSRKMFSVELNIEVGGRNNVGEIDCHSNVAGWVRSSDDAVILVDELPKRQN
jgi:hypothetical protein